MENNKAHINCKYKNKQKVMIKKGFYKGTRGSIKDIEETKEGFLYTLETNDGELQVKEEYLIKRLF